MSSLVSIIIPCFNAEAFIGETLNSVIHQSYSNLEIIIINDGSTDNSLNVIESFKDERIQVINQNNNGVSRARNEGMLKSKGDFILFLDADDVLSHSFVQSRMEIFERNPNVNLVGSVVHVFQGSVSVILKTQFSIVESIKRDVLLYQEKSTTTPSSYMWRRSIFSNDHEIFHPALSSTADRYVLLKYEALINGLLCDDESACLYYRTTPDSMSSKLNARLVDDNERLYELLLAENILSKMDKLYLRKGFYILYRSNLRIMRPFRAATYFLKWLFS